MLPTLLLALALAPLVADDGPTDHDDRIRTVRGRDCTQRFYKRELDSLWDDFAPPMQAAFGSVEQLSAFRDTVDVQMGAETEVVAEKTFRSGAYGVYQRIARFDKYPRLVQVVWSFGADLGIEGFSITPLQTEAPSEYLDYETRAVMRLPFEGEWFVVWGGRTIEQNYHAFTEDQRFAYDILVVEKGQTHTGDGTRNEDYFAFGRRVLAPADGVVVAVGDGVPDNVPGEMNPAQALGNHVILDHGHDEYTFMAHFQQGSVAVKPGDTVKAGDFLGLCGNSGNTTESHIHIHLQDTPVFGAGQGKPLPFTHYVADGRPVDRGEPVKGQRVRPQ